MRGEAGLQEFFFRSFGPHFGRKTRGGGAGPPAPPLDPPLLQWMVGGGGRCPKFFFSVLRASLWSKHKGGPSPPGASPGSAAAAIHALKLYCFLNVCTVATVFILCVLYWVFDVVSMIYLQKSWCFCSLKNSRLKIKFQYLGNSLETHASVRSFSAVSWFSLTLRQHQHIYF